MVLASAAVGVPPLAAVSLAAGASGQRRWEFGACCLVGRVARFALLVLPAAWALS
jgi:membrane protein YqaA with SNARE-associated domain